METTFTFEVKGRKYVAERLDVFAQLFVVRKLAPVFAAAVPKGMTTAGLAGMLDRPVADILPGLADVAASMPEDDVKAVLLRLLTVVRCEQPGLAGWAPMVAGGQMMDATLSLPDMLQVAFHSARFSLADFFSGLPQLSSGAATSKQKGP